MAQQIEARMIPKGTILYRSFNDDSRRIGYWFSLNKNNTYRYGSKTSEFKLSRNITLIDITDDKFYNILKQKLIEHTNIQPNLKQDHPMILFPLGFDDINFYRDMARMSEINVDSITFNPYINTESLLYFNGRSRLSIHQYDIAFVSFLKYIFGNDCDGIVSLKDFPNIIRNGMHPSELCVFDNSHIEYIGDIPQIMSGGESLHNQLYSLLPPLYLDNEFIRKTSDLTRINELMKRNIKSNIKLHIIPLDEALKQINNPNSTSYIQNGGDSTQPSDIPLLPPLYLDNEFIRKTSDNSFIDKLDTSKLRTKVKLINKPFDELISKNSSSNDIPTIKNNTYKKFKTTRKRKNK